MKISINRPCYTMASADGSAAELTMYGDIVEAVPTDWWTGEPIEGQYIVQSEFLEDLKAIEGCKEITIRMNSCGGDAGVSVLIHNRLRELADNGAKLTCIVDGVAMSGGSLIMCACDTVRVNPSSLVMCHKCWTMLFGCYNADELRQMATTNDAYDKSQVAIYKRKTGQTDTVLLHMMANTTYMTGSEAVEKGFADELIEDAEPLVIAASADGRSLFVRGREMHLAPGMFAPDTIPTVTPEAKAPDGIDTNQPVVTGGDEGGNSMTIEELREQYPEEVGQIEADARASVDTGTAATEAVQAEQRRQQDIDAVAPLFDDDLVREARYGEKACTAQELSYRAAMKAAAQGRQFLTGLGADADASGAEGVPAAPGTDDAEDEDSPEAIKTAAQAAVKAYKAMKEGK